jgi:RHH-type proline utilization regulon transcriptional repressor/proline dehydrogenase/delta 1-pyrroline-5-carboxylate dehydrogenase
MTPDPRPFHALGQALRAHRSPLRDAITQATRQDEAACVQALLTEGTLDADTSQATRTLALDLITRLRERPPGLGREGLVQAMMQEFSLSTQEGVALMCLAEALLRVPDDATRDALIRDKLADADWSAHLGHSPSLFVNAATWGLVLTGKLVGTHAETGLRAALRRVVSKGGETLVRKSVDITMRLLGEQFVIGETMAQALHQARRHEAQGYRHSYDMLGEAALTDEDAQRYLDAYEGAIHALSHAVRGRHLYEGPGISIKLSALHPRYGRAQYAQVMDTLYPRLLHLVRLAHDHGIGINIDAEESERLDISLDLLERLCLEPDLDRWDGIGFVVQAYQKRAPFVIDHLIDLARRSGHRLMVRLVKGAYWDSEIKRAQIEGLPDYPVYTRKAHTDLAYLACARRMLAAPAEIYPQFATHNAHTVAAIMNLAGPDCQPGQYEFQCLHGMGEPLYDLIVPPQAQGGLNRPCRIYAPVGTHETLLAYLVRRLLENGANSSFVNRVADPAIDLDALVLDPATAVLHAAAIDGIVGAPHPAIPLPWHLNSDRVLSPGLDLHDEQVLHHLHADLAREALPHVDVQPIVAHPLSTDAADWQVIRNPGDRRDAVGTVRWASLDDVRQAVATARAHAPLWEATPVTDRADMLERAAELMQQRRPMLINLLVREAGKTLPNAVGEVREAMDFLRYHAAQARADLQDGHHHPLGPLVCISPWNFPLAIFTGQIAAALAAGNTVLAKPAEQTPLIAAQAVRLLHEAGVPRQALQCLPGLGETVGAALVAHPDIQGVLFTGSTQVARHLQAQLATRVNARGQPLTLVAETGGQNAMIVDSSALPEQVVQDALTSAFDSAGQRCSALRVLCVQEDIAERVLHMLRGAMQTLQIGPPDRLHTDIGPLIDQDALAAVELHIATLRACDRPVFQADTALQAVSELSGGCFVAPTLIELHSLDELVHEVFGPVLHVIRYRREDRGALLDRLHAMGYGLTLGIHSRIDETIDDLCERARIGNIYVNRNMIGAVVGVQPFGGEGLSGTGPKAGGPLYLHRLLHPHADTSLRARTLLRLAEDSRTSPATDTPLQSLIDWLDSRPVPHAHALLRHARLLQQTAFGPIEQPLPGPTGERNRYRLRPRGPVLCVAHLTADLLYQLAVVLASGNRAVWLERPALHPLHLSLPESVRDWIDMVPDPDAVPWQSVLMHGAPHDVVEMAEYLSERPGPILGFQALPTGWRQPLCMTAWRLMCEQTITVNTTAAGGNASLMSLSEPLRPTSMRAHAP